MSKFKKPDITHKIINFYEVDDVKKISKPSIDNLYPATNIKINTINLVVGGTGCGKSNAIMNLLYLSSHGQGVFAKIILVCKTDETLYTFLKKKIPPEQLIIYKSINDLPDCNTFETQYTKEPKQREETLLIIDDFIADCEDKKMRQKIENFAIFGRKKALTQIYLAQSYFKVPKTIRLQLHYLWLLSLPNKKDLSLVLSSYSLPVEENDLKEMVKEATKEKLSFLKINLNCSCDLNEKFSIGFLDHFNINVDEPILDV
jgi:energy-coupling factor transporter ATP-binding protein EcfA2